MALPGRLDLAMYQGDTFERVLNVFDESTDGTVIETDLTGYTAKAQIRATVGGQLIGEFTCTITLPNIISLSIAAGLSAVLTSGVWDLQITSPDGKVRTLVAGTVTVTPEVTVVV